MTKLTLGYETSTVRLSAASMGTSKLCVVTNKYNIYIYWFHLFHVFEQDKKPGKMLGRYFPISGLKETYESEVHD